MSSPEHWESFKKTQTLPMKGSFPAAEKPTQGTIEHRDHLHWCTARPRLALKDNSLVAQTWPFDRNREPRQRNDRMNLSLNPIIATTRKIGLPAKSSKLGEWMHPEWRKFASRKP